MTNNPSAGYIGEVRYGDSESLKDLPAGEWIIQVCPNGGWKAVRVDLERLTVPATTLGILNSAMSFWPPRMRNRPEPVLEIRDWMCPFCRRMYTEPNGYHLAPERLPDFKVCDSPRCRSKADLLNQPLPKP